MSTPGHAVKSAKTYVDYAATGAKKLSEWSAAAQKLQKQGETLSEIDDVLTKLAFVAKISTALQVVSVGLTVVQMFLPVKSKEDQILDAVKAVGAQVNTMSHDMSVQMKQLTSVVWDATARSNLENHLTDIDVAHGYLATIAAKRRAGQDFSFELGQLQSFNSNKLMSAVTGIEHYVTGTATAPNLLKLIYNASYGNVRAVGNMAGYLLSQAQLAISTHAAIAALLAETKAKAKGKPWGDAERIKLADDIAGDVRMQDSYAGRLKVISDACHAWAVKCVDPIERASNIENYVHDHKYAPMVLSKADAQGTAERVVAALTGNWPWLNFTALVYPPLAGFDRHAYQYSASEKSALSFFREKDATGGELNMVLYFTPRKTAKRPKLLRPADGDKAKGKRRNAIDQIGLMLNAHKRFGFGLWHQVNVDDLRPYFLLYGSLTYPASPTHWHGDLVWLGYNDEDQEITTRPKKSVDKFMGLASYNPVTLYRHVDYRPEGTRGGTIDHYYWQGYNALVIHV